MDDSPYAEYHRRQDEAIGDAPPYPADRFGGRGIVMAAGGPRLFANAWVNLNPPHPSRLTRTEAEIVAASPFRYVRRATDERTLQLVPGGRIGAGAAAAERAWRLEPHDTGPTLLIEGDFGVICRLRLDRDGGWRGRWLQFEQMPIELIPLG